MWSFSRSAPAPAPAPTAWASTPRLRLRPTRADDLPYVAQLDADPLQRPASQPWALPQHESALRFDDYRHLILEAGPGLVRVGFAVLAGCRNPERSVEIKRLVCQYPGEGHGRAALQILKHIAFDPLAAQRLWLKVREGNLPARLLASDEGFVLEGRLRDAVRAATGPGREALIVMSMLAPEFQSRRAAAQELHA